MSRCLPLRRLQPSPTGSRRGRYREFTIGRGWWIMPTVMLGAQVVASFVLAEWTRFSRESPWDWILFVWLMIGSPTLAAILLSPGFARYHAAMAVVAVGSGSAVFALAGEPTPGLIVISTVVTAIQVFMIRMTGKPPWLIRPAKGRDPRASIGWLLSMTLVTAVLIAWIRRTIELEAYFMSVVCLGLAVLAAIAGNLVARLRRARTRWTILIVAAVLGVVVRLDVEKGIWLVGYGIPAGSPFLANILGTAPAASLIIVTLVHRMMTVKWERVAPMATPTLDPNEEPSSERGNASGATPEPEQAMIRHRRRVAQSRTPQQHAEIVEQLQTAAMRAIRSDPGAYRTFLARNYRKRRADEVAKLLAQLMPNDSTHE